MHAPPYRPQKERPKYADHEKRAKESLDPELLSPLSKKLIEYASIADLEVLSAGHTCAHTAGTHSRHTQQAHTADTHSRHMR